MLPSMIDSDNKLITAMGMSMMMIVGSFALLQVIQQMTARPAAEAEHYGTFWFGAQGYIMNVSYAADEELQYVGEAVPGTLDSDAGWRIYKYGYVIDPATGDAISGTLRYADGTKLFDKIWDNRVDYEYS